LYYNLRGMANLSARIPTPLVKRVDAVLGVYGGSKTTVAVNALECWLDAFEAATDTEKMRMILRPKTQAKSKRRVTA
jgi:hypothetical protein